MGKALLLLSKKMSRRGLADFIEIQLNKINENSNVLNVGAGGEIGFLVSEIALRKNLKVLSMDIDYERGPDIVADICSIQYQDEFDCIILSEVLEHVKDPQKAINNIYSALKVNGTLIITVPFIFPIHDRPYDYFRYTKYGLMMLLEKYSFVKVEERFGWAETLSILTCRFIREGKGRPFFTSFLVVLSFFMFPVLVCVSKCYKSDFITAGYQVVAIKR